MFLMKSAFILFLCLGLGYMLCVVAKKQEGILKTLGYTIGVSIITLSLLYSLFVDEAKWPYLCGMGKASKYGFKPCPMMNK